MLSRLVITFLPRSKCLLISWLQSPSAVILVVLKCECISKSLEGLLRYRFLGPMKHIHSFWFSRAEVGLGIPIAKMFLGSANGIDLGTSLRNWLFYNMNAVEAREELLYQIWVIFHVFTSMASVILSLWYSLFSFFGHISSPHPLGRNIEKSPS